jgi:hypothetical protein
VGLLRPTPLGAVGGDLLQDLWWDRAFVLADAIVDGEAQVLVARGEEVDEVFGQRDLEPPLAVGGLGGVGSQPTASMRSKTSR